MSNSEKVLNNINFESTDNEFDLKFLIECLSRRRKIVITIFSSVLFFFCYAFSSKKVWRGQFQIVLNKRIKTL